MPPSQLKRLRTSLREQGLLGPTQKKRKKNGRPTNDERYARESKLSAVRESFNSFGNASQSRPQKFPVLSSKKESGASGGNAISKGEREAMRRDTRLWEKEQRNKAGGITDNRIGEYNPHLSEEQRMLERFTNERKRSKKRASMFNLEEDAEDGLTHMGVPLASKMDISNTIDDYGEESEELSSEDDRRDQRLPERKDDLRRLEPDRVLSKAEVMKDVIAKSKLHKYERQKARENDRELRANIDQTSRETMDAIRGILPTQGTATNGLTPLEPSNGVASVRDAKVDPDKNYDLKVKLLSQDPRSQPAERTQGEDEKQAEQDAHMKKLEEQRLMRMRGHTVFDDQPPSDVDNDVIDDEEPDDAMAFGLENPLTNGTELGVEDEDDFFIEDELVADYDGSELGSDVEEEDATGSSSEVEEDDDEFIRGVLSHEDTVMAQKAQKTQKTAPSNDAAIENTISCPQNHAEMLELCGDRPVSEHPSLVQKVRACYQPQLHPDNQEKLVAFATVLVEHIKYMADNHLDPALATIETLIRHIHSLSRKYPLPIAVAFRSQLMEMHRANPYLTSGHCVILTAIGTIYPTSDRFHQVVNPAVTIMAHWLEMARPQTPRDRAYGAFLTALCLKYHAYSQRYMPELIRFSTAVLQSRDTDPAEYPDHLASLNRMADLWSSKSAFAELFHPTLTNLLSSRQPLKSASIDLSVNLQQKLQASRLARRPLELHHHRPLPIRSSIPKFEPNFNPDRHRGTYDPDRERAASQRLRQEHRREKKAVVRELRRDAGTNAREALREKRERDRAYEEKYRRLVAEIQGEEGHEAKEYEREKRARKGRK